MGADLSVIPYKIDKTNWIEKSRTPQKQIIAEAKTIIENLSPEEIKLVMTDINLNTYPTRKLEADLKAWKNHYTTTGEVLPVPEFAKTWLAEGIASVFEDNGRDIHKFRSSAHPNTLLIVRGHTEWMDNPWSIEVAIGLAPKLPALAEYLKLGII